MDKCYIYVIEGLYVLCAYCVKLAELCASNCKKAWFCTLAQEGGYGEVCTYLLSSAEWDFDAMCL